MSSSTIKSLIASLKEISKEPFKIEDEELRHELSQALSNAQIAVESPLETVHRLSFGVSASKDHQQEFLLT